ncbi:MAG: helix-turn-helix domain-containing protein [Actinomycetota bacterium]|uniref:Helix-turn-helix domain-containing protein n=1 Tax=Mycobacterium lentiflavum TaxID=141349 RepID=A0ABY3UZ07_MYCLN|nr:helix-turn-helix domain-containing protein [Mycobacterium lentiflavum]MEE3062479.1 helix-turn-helix domain-containing protein [Actinomycetota bacterium]ULP43621.1 helix-turn-helix domain-containing protein [Mycobacterium lentiflavum]
MSAAPETHGVRRGGAADPYVVELGRLMLARAPRMGKEMAELLCRQIDAYRDGNVVAKDQVVESCVANLTFIFDSLNREGDADVAPAERTGTERAVAGVPLPAVMTAYRIGFRFMWEQTLATARAAAIPTDSILDATARVFLAQEIFTEAMSNAYRQQLTAQILEREEERSALVEALLSRRITERQSLWEAADLLRLPTSGPYAVVAAELPAIGKLGLPAIENKLSARDIRSAWRLLPDLQVGIVHLSGPSPESLGTLVEVLGHAATARVGISPPFHELAETSDALRLARMAVAGKPSDDTLVAVFDDTPLAVAAVSAPEVMQRIKSMVLRRLDELPDEERAVLLSTFRAWVEVGGSANDTAAKIYCHPNTVRHRLHRVEELTGRSLSRPRDIAELCLALEVEARLP